MVKSTERVCYYETLGVEPNCSMDDVRHAYHELSKLYHPDKYNSSCGMSKDEASAKFLQIKDAYNILKEPDELPETFNPDLESIFDIINCNGYSDTGNGFYKVYSDVFDRIYANERAFQETYELPWDSVRKPPAMGNLESTYPEVVQFYNYWFKFSSIMDFSWEDDEYDLSQISRRRLKQWSRLNMKARMKAKKEYNNKVRSLAQNAKRLDRRIMEMKERREQERKREMKEERERKRLREKELEKAAKEYGDPKEEEREEWECVVCRKGFRSEKQCRNHEQSRKHLRMVSELLKLLSQHHDIDSESMDYEAKGDQMVGESEEFPNVVDDNKWENFGKLAVEFDEEEEEEMDEMEALQAMVERRKRMEQVGEQFFESVAEYMVFSSQVENDDDEVVINQDLLKNNNIAKEKRPKRRRRVKNTRINPQDASSLKQSKPTLEVSG